MRIDNALAQTGLCLRRETRMFCREHEVVAAGQRVTTANARVDPSSISVDGVLISPSPGDILHIALFKPPGFVCTHALNRDGKTVYSLLPSEWQLREPTLASIGRLDKEASGLLLLTQCGVLNARLSTPRRGCIKEYVVSLARPLSADGREAAAFASGALELVDGGMAAPATLFAHKDPSLRHVCKVELGEGRHHQLRRMFAAVGHSVTGIHRTAFAGLRLSDMRLSEGGWRLLTDDDLITALRASSSSARIVPRNGVGHRFRIRGIGGDALDAESQGDGGDSDGDCSSSGADESHDSVLQSRPH